jgi:hypothetical protein
VARLIERTRNRLPPTAAIIIIVIIRFARAS